MSCVNADLTLAQKLALNARNNDHDHDRLVTTTDIAYDLRHHFDGDGDGGVTRFEWVLGWLCHYGDSGDFARFVWGRVAGGAHSIRASHFSGPPFDTGVALDAFTATNRRRYEEWAAQSAAVIG